MKTELISFLSTDKLELPGLLYTPQKPTKKVAVWLHGMGDSGVIYNPLRINLLARELTARGIALLAFNNRGAHNKKRLKIRDDSLPKEERCYQAGTHHELIADCLHDIDGAVLFLADRGYEELYLAGHSSGANKICVYDFLSRDNPFSKYVLAGAGDDCGLWYMGLGDARFWKTLSLAKQHVADGKPHRTMPKYSGMSPFSAQSAADLIDPDGPYNTFPFFEVAHKRLGHKELFQEFGGITKPTLVLYGEYDEAAASAGSVADAVRILKKHANHHTTIDYEIIADTNHTFDEKEADLAHIIATWLAGDIA